MAGLYHFSQVALAGAKGQLRDDELGQWSREDDPQMKNSAVEGGLVDTKGDSEPEYIISALREDYVKDSFLTLSVAEKYLLEVDGNSRDELANPMRLMDFFKGSSRSFGIPSLSTMAEDFELVANLYQQSEVQTTKEHAACGMLKLIALMREVLRVHQFGHRNHDPSATEDDSITRLLKESLKIGKTSCFRVLVIDNTSTGVSLLRGSPKTSALPIEFCRDSLEGLGKLLKENFNALIIGRVLDPMPPDAIFAALKTAARKVPPIIGITKDPEAWTSRVLQPEVILERSFMLSEHLPQALERLVEQEIGQAESDPRRQALLML